MRGVAGAALAALLAATGAAGHEGHAHAPEPQPIAADPEPAPFFPSAIGGPFRLVDQFGRERTEADPDGRPQLVFFGYATCPGICSSVLPQLAELTDQLKSAGVEVAPILITIDPAIDTVESLGPAAAEIHPDLIGLTGAPQALAAARDAFQVSAEFLFVDPQYGPIYAHGSYIYLLDPQGGFLTLLPPILSTERMAEIVRSYL